MNGRLLTGLRERRLRRGRAHRLYAALVEQARNPIFYRDLSVPDTVDGRFDLIVLHTFLIVRRVRSIPNGGVALGQAIFDVMMADMDQGLRVLGVGDLGVGRRIKTMTKAFMGRCQAYDAAWNGGPEAMAGALTRNVFRSEADVPKPEARAMARYAFAAEALLARQPDEAIGEGLLAFPSPRAA
jgi:cytochrome b pre-mRNA-processing protein 3